MASSKSFKLLLLAFSFWYASFPMIDGFWDLREWISFKFPLTAMVKLVDCQNVAHLVLDLPIRWWCPTGRWTKMNAFRRHLNYRRPCLLLH
ncbi:hypothetical protein BpHYR1_003181 [Brachionus plicatilis]|uniref:Uncharacterized protein n=1 Tax=Brachionus plicatilis TaxID=10195 RepID=A0A3M7RNZ9_BRAPC|nr:hypothetical protein BpHYR1_003181 [Brachionus plicatilis]